MSEIDNGRIAGEDAFRTIIEPFRIRSVEPIPMLSREERVTAIKEAGLNLFGLPAEKVTIDLLTDSGTGALSTAQWGAMMVGDESYAGSRSGARLVDTVRQISGHPHVFPEHQGRGAERILAQTVLEAGSVVISNTHFDTTRANIEAVGAVAIDLPIPEALHPEVEHDFKGNMDIERLRAQLRQDAGRVALVILTVTNNAVGGQPVSMANVEAVREACLDAGVPFFLDAARFAENAWFIKTREPGFADWEVCDIVHCMFSMVDGFTLSAKKDGLAHIGGILATRLDEWAERFRAALPIAEGFPSYGGLAGRDLEAVATGLIEAMDHNYLAYRIRSIGYLAEALDRAGMPVVQPPGGHAVFIDAGRLLPHIPPEAFPAQSLGIAWYEEGGVRGVEVGSLMFPGARMELLRFAIPRRTYTQAHMDYVIEIADRVIARAPTLEGLRIVQAPAALRHFGAQLSWLSDPSDPHTPCTGSCGHSGTCRSTASHKST